MQQERFTEKEKINRHVKNFNISLKHKFSSIAKFMLKIYGFIGII